MSGIHYPRKEKTWKKGIEMSVYIREKYYKICCSRYRVASGECYGFAGVAMITAASTAAFSSRYSTAVFGVFMTIAVMCILCAKQIKHTMKRDLKFIEEGDFLWKYDNVRELLPDRYPKTCKILTESEDEPCIILQAHFYFKEGTGVYLIKRESKTEYSRISSALCNMNEEIQAFIT